MTTQKSHSDSAWEIIEREKKRDAVVRRIGIAAWIITFALAIVFAVLVVASGFTALKDFLNRGVSFEFFPDLLEPIIISLGKVSLVLALASTIAIFLRVRTASLNEIQLRLAALEDMLVARADKID